MKNNIYLSVASHGCYVGNSLKQRLSLHKVDFIFNFFFSFAFLKGNFLIQTSVTKYPRAGLDVRR